MTEISGTNTVRVTLDQVEQLDLTRSDFKSDADYQLFLDAVSNAQQQRAEGISNPALEIPEPVDPAILESLDNHLQDFAMYFGDSNLDVFAAFYEMLQQMRQNAKLDRQASRDAEIATMKEAADKIRAAGLFAMASGIVSGTMGIVGGAFSFAGAVKGMSTAMGKGVTPPTTTPDDGSTPVTRPRSDALTGTGDPRAPSPLLNADFQTRAQFGQMQMYKYQAIGQMFQGLGQILSGALEYGKAEMDAQKAELDAEAAQHRYEVQSEDEIVSNMLQSLTEVRQKLDEYFKSVNEREQRIWS